WTAEGDRDEAIVRADPPKLTKQTCDKLRTSSTATAGELGKVVSFEAGEYRVRLTVGGEHVGTDPVKVMLRVMGEDVKAFDVKATADKPEVIEAKLKVKPGTGRVGVAFLNPDADKQWALHLKAVEVEGPFDPPTVTYPEVH